MKNEGEKDTHAGLGVVALLLESCHGGGGRPGVAGILNCRGCARGPGAPG